MLRILAVLLLLANAGWFAWSQWVREPAHAPAVRRPPAPRLVLAREAPPPVPGQRLPERPGDFCRSLGPFTELADAARASTLLRESGLQPRQRAGEGVVWKGWQVEVGGVADAATASGIIERLRRFGISDAYPLPGTGRDVTISLGLFTEEPYALRRLDDAKALGLDARISERQRTGTLYWIDVDVVPPAELPDPSTFDGGSGRILRLEIRPCDEAGRTSEPVPEVARSGAVPG
ncbi:MAG: hypothetical protein FJ191_13360 [Gammaproteobacteria bacterium]|nr:hypothetical protein [Gammaproteobacteria bacterium]